MTGSRQSSQAARSPAKKLAPGATPDWLSSGEVRKYRRGERIIEAGTPLTKWIAISAGAAFAAARAASDTKVAVATLWLGDVIGAESPVGRQAARYDVTALVDVTTVEIPLATARDRANGPGEAAGSELFAATADRLQDQITMRLAGNGLQRLMNVLATLATALSSSSHSVVGNSLSLPVSQSCIGYLAGLSRRQAWIYLGQLAELGWVKTGRTKVAIEGVSAWMALTREVEVRGLECIASVDQCDATLQLLASLVR
ncbi:cyclic nucleotide-binding domain-containing protein [Roseateles noduli]|uniref:cyclic nucleotide-binding domain-containing protein n=1 Tax=Roseateles noduli TaxID=2052484 RepID=UPI003D64F8F3